MTALSLGLVSHQSVRIFCAVVMEVCETVLPRANSLEICGLHSVRRDIEHSATVQMASLISEMMRN